MINDYVDKGPADLQEFLYSSEKKEYTVELVKPKISQVLKYMDVAIDCLKSENSDTVYA